MRYLLILFSMLVFIACSGDRRTDTPVPPPDEQSDQSAEQPDNDSTPSEAMSPDDCSDAGGTFRPSRGDLVECEPGETKLGNVAFGIEGGVCCK